MAEKNPVRIGIRAEDKNIWERRTPLLPVDVALLREKYGIEFVVQSSKIRAYTDEEYVKAGATVSDNLTDCKIIFAIKEIPIHLLEREKTYVFFSHTIKGQKHNMPMLRKLLELNCNLIDYEKIVSKAGKRLIFFGNYAGYAGMIDTLWALGKRLNYEGIENPFYNLKKTYEYGNLENAKKALQKISAEIKSNGLHRSLVPFVCGFTGYGNVSQGAQLMYDILPTVEIEPSELKNVFKKSTHDPAQLYKVVFKEEHMVKGVNKTAKFELQDYYKNPHKYKSCFEQYLKYLTVLVNGIYWEEKYPRFVTKKYLKKLYSGSKPRLKVIGDISCDIGGSVECTVRATQPDKPIYVYDVFKDIAIDGWEGNGPVIMAVDNLPCELPQEASAHFSNALKEFVPYIAKADFSVDFENCNLPPEVKNAVIVYHGKLTPNYQYISNFL